MKYCNACAGKLEKRIPEGDNYYRYVCPACNTIYYSNPKIIVGSLPVWKGNTVLLCRRAIEPRYGYWTLPSGFMENNETVQDGAVRETWEEAKAKVNIQYLHTLYNLAHISQVYLLFKAELIGPKYAPGEESLEVRLFSEKEIPWDKIAFSSIYYCLEHFFQEDIADGLDVQKTHYGSYVRKQS